MSKTITADTKALKEICEWAFRTKKQILVAGPPGFGKTQIMEAVARAMGFVYKILPAKCWEPTDPKGIPGISSEEPFARFRPIQELYQLAHSNEPTVVNLDDLHYAQESVQAVITSFLTNERGFYEARMPENILFVGTCNRMEDNAGSNGIIKPLEDRFHAIVHVDSSNNEDWIEWGKISKRLHSQVTVYLEHVAPQHAYEFNPDLELEKSATHRAWEKMSEALYDGIPESVQTNIICSIVGESVGILFDGFLRGVAKLPGLSRILTDPDGVPVPEEPERIFGLVGVLANKADKDNWGQIMRFARRMPAEYTAVLVNEGITRSKEIQIHEATRDYYTTQRII